MKAGRSNHLDCTKRWEQRLIQSEGVCIFHPFLFLLRLSFVPSFPYFPIFFFYIKRDFRWSAWPSKIILITNRFKKICRMSGTEASLALID